MSSHCLGLGAHSAGKSIVFKSRQLAVGEGPGAMSVQNQLNGRPDGASCCRENNEESRALSSLTHTHTHSAEDRERVSAGRTLAK